MLHAACELPRLRLCHGADRRAAAGLRKTFGAKNFQNGDAIPANLSDSDWENTASGAVAVYGEEAYVQVSPDGDAWMSHGR